MGVGSLVLGVVALLVGLMGFVPVVGVVSLLAPVLSIFGCVLGGIGISRAKQEGVSSGLAVAGLVVNIVAFVITLPIALTCGACNACMTGAAMMGPYDGGAGWRVYRTDAGVQVWQGGSGGPPPFVPLAPNAPGTVPGAPPIVAPPVEPPPGAPQPQFPPPPMPGQPTAPGMVPDPSTPGAPGPSGVAPPPAADPSSGARSDVAAPIGPTPEAEPRPADRRARGRRTGGGVSAVGPESPAVGPGSSEPRAVPARRASRPSSRAVGPESPVNAAAW